MRPFPAFVLKFASALGVAACLSSPVGGQVVDGWGWSIIIPSVAQTDILGQQLRELRQKEEAAVVSGSAPVSQAQAARDPALLRYTPSKERRSANLAAFLAKSRQKDAAGARSLEELFAQGDIIDRMAPLIAPYGLRVDDVADAYTIWWIDAWQAVHRRNETNDKGTVAAVRAQAARALSSTRELAGADDAGKQRFAEALFLQAMLLEAAMDQAKGDPTMLGKVSEAAAQGARGMGLDMATMTLTAKGFVATAPDRAAR